MAGVSFKQNLCQNLRTAYVRRVSCVLAYVRRRTCVRTSYARFAYDLSWI